MLQALGAIGGLALVGLGVRAGIVMIREEYNFAQGVYESGFKKRQQDSKLQATDELDCCDIESGGGEGGEPYEEFECQDARPESPHPSVPSTHSPTEHVENVENVVRVPPPGNCFPPPPPRSPRSSDVLTTKITQFTPVAEPIEPVEPVEPYVDFVSGRQQSDLSKFAVVHPPAPAPLHVRS